MAWQGDHPENPASAQAAWPFKPELVSASAAEVAWAA
jgi:hypothetical protein